MTFEVCSVNDLNTEQIARLKKMSNFEYKEWDNYYGYYGFLKINDIKELDDFRKAMERKIIIDYDEFEHENIIIIYNGWIE